MGIFKLLKNVDGAVKLVKFKQERLMSAAASGGLISDDLFQRVKKGACAAYTMAWLQEKYAPPGASKFERSQGVDSSQAKLSIGTAAAHVYAQLDYERSPYGTDSLFLTYEMHASGTCRKDFLTDLCLELCTTLKPGTGAYVSYQFTEAGDRHAVGLFRQDTRYVHFFDPNVGEYRLDLDGKGTGRNQPGMAFFSQYLAILLARFRSQPRECVGYIMAKGGKSIGQEF